MDHQADTTAATPTMSSSSSFFDYVDIGNQTDATDDNSTAATPIGSLTDLIVSNYWNDNLSEDFSSIVTTTETPPRRGDGYRPTSAIDIGNRNSSGNLSGNSTAPETPSHRHGYRPTAANTIGSGNLSGNSTTSDTASGRDGYRPSVGIDIRNRNGDFDMIGSANLSGYSTTSETVFSCDDYMSIDTSDDPLFHEDDGYYSVSNFMRDLGGSDTLSWTDPALTGSKTSLCVFYPTQTNLSSFPYSIHEKIKAVLSHFIVNPTSKILAQFWAPKTVAGRRTLTTLDQPFGVCGINRGFAAYRKLSLDYKIDVDSEKEDDFGIPGRVFHNKWPEVTPDVKSYSIQEYPLRQSAVLFGVKRSLALPIFEHSGGCCVGVLEIVDAEENVLFVDLLRTVHWAIGFATLRSSYMYFNAEIQICPPHAADELHGILKMVGATHRLLLAQTWVIGKYNDATDHNLANSGNSFGRKFAVVASTYGMPYYERDTLMTFYFRRSCKEHLIREGQGVVGKVLSDYEPRFCTNVTQLSTTGYPFAICARNSGLSACLAVCLNNINDENEVYVLEFFLPPCNGQIPETLFLSILRTMTERLRNFKISSGEEGDEISVKVIELPLTNEVDAFKPNISVLSAASSEIQKEVEEQLESGIQIIKGSSAMIVRNVENNPTFTSSRRTYSGANSSERKQEATEVSISYEVLKQQFGTKLEVAADTLGVSRSTLKRICRKHDISRWPSSRRKKGNHSLASSSAKNVSELGVRDPSSLTPPRKEVTAAVMPLVATSCVSVKAIYKTDIIRFRLSSSSGMAELVENVTKRLNLEVKSFKLKFEDDDSDMVLLTCDEDLQECFELTRLSGRATVKISIEHDTSHAP